MPGLRQSEATGSLAVTCGSPCTRDKEPLFPAVLHALRWPGAWGSGISYPRRPEREPVTQ